jgi:hypothetical protein
MITSLDPFIRNTLVHNTQKLDKKTSKKIAMYVNNPQLPRQKKTSILAVQFIDKRSIIPVTKNNKILF